MTKLLNGRDVVEVMNADTTKSVKELEQRGVKPTLAIVRVGELKDEIAYERGAIKRCEDVGVATSKYLLSKDATQKQVLDTIIRLNDDASIHGILLLCPLPAHIDEDVVRNAINPDKDVDGITDKSIASVYAGENVGFAPCTAQSCIELLEHYNYDFSGKNAVVVGRSLVVGKPVAMMMLDRNSTVTIAHSRSINLPEIVRQADLVIAAVGRARLVDANHLRPGQTVIDVGINVENNGQLVGDVDFSAAVNIVDAITPVPGGIGKVTTSVLCKHVVQAATKFANN
ncbi:MAG: bifunctional 5,10-methylene-tetrahydrofolate dehydrogenase/5,10-methylene-tetrahydrofolate cyclohydrolase [Coriobacteriales bacterium]|jgi:methylenetetrahydrofolate dehydrogenase (NADP+)/methenyltetrahydrofolate cyclohydrolase|nr:bifunctional 5,10-methylene-tetrahydrofolate dehydrogenase/5,10-methylene-tetrahydrofolate cyclohydrolase [Coriobacteriales bacterium]